jgi:hypothetical protein
MEREETWEGAVETSGEAVEISLYGFFYLQGEGVRRFSKFRPKYFRKFLGFSDAAAYPPEERFWFL